MSFQRYEKQNQYEGNNGMHWFRSLRYRAVRSIFPMMRFWGLGSALISMALFCLTSHLCAESSRLVTSATDSINTVTDCNMSMRCYFVMNIKLVNYTCLLTPVHRISDLLNLNILYVVYNLDVVYRISINSVFGKATNFTKK